MPFRARNHGLLPYVYAIPAVAITLGLRLLLSHWTGAGAPFLLFFTAVLLFGVIWGAGPALWVGILSAPIAGYLFVFQAHYSVAQAVAQSILFLIEVSLICWVVAQMHRAWSREREIFMRMESSNKLLQSLLENSPNVIFIRDEQGRYILANKKAAQLLGTTEDGLKGKTNFELFPQKTAEALKAADEAVLKANRGLTTEETIEFNTQAHVFLATKFPYFDAEGKRLGICGILADITDRKRAEKALQLREAELQEAQHVAHMGSWVRDRTGKILFWSEELYRVFGLDPKGPAPDLDATFRMYTPETVARLKPLIARTLTDGTPYRIESQFRRPDGSLGWIRRGHPGRIRADHRIQRNGPGHHRDQATSANERRMDIGDRARSEATYRSDRAVRRNAAQAALR